MKTKNNLKTMLFAGIVTLPLLGCSGDSNKLEEQKYIDEQGINHHILDNKKPFGVYDTHIVCLKPTKDGFCDHFNDASLRVLQNNFYGLNHPQAEPWHKDITKIQFVKKDGQIFISDSITLNHPDGKGYLVLEKNSGDVTSCGFTLGSCSNIGNFFEKFNSH